MEKEICITEKTSPQVVDTIFAAKVSLLNLSKVVFSFGQRTSRTMQTNWKEPRGQQQNDQRSKKIMTKTEREIIVFVSFRKEKTEERHENNLQIHKRLQK